MNDLTFNGNYDLYAFKINLNKYGVQSLYLDKAVNIPSGISATYISEVIKNETGQYKVTWKDIFNIIPAYTPVVLWGKGNEHINLFYNDKCKDESPQDNKLSGVLERTLVTDLKNYNKETQNLLTLGMSKDGEIGMFTFSGTAIAANRIYLILPKNK